MSSMDFSPVKPHQRLWISIALDQLIQRYQLIFLVAVLKLENLGILINCTIFPFLEQCIVAAAISRPGSLLTSVYYHQPNQTIDIFLTIGQG